MAIAMVRRKSAELTEASPRRRGPRPAPPTRRRRARGSWSTFRLFLRCVAVPDPGLTTRTSRPVSGTEVLQIAWPWEDHLRSSIKGGCTGGTAPRTPSAGRGGLRPLACATKTPPGARPWRAAPPPWRPRRCPPQLPKSTTGSASPVNRRGPRQQRFRLRLHLRRRPLRLRIPVLLLQHHLRRSQQHLPPLRIPSLPVQRTLRSKLHAWPELARGFFFHHPGLGPDLSVVENG